MAPRPKDQEKDLRPKRMVTLAHADLGAERAAFAALRAAMFAVQDTVAQRLFADDPLLAPITKARVAAALARLQGEDKPEWNAAYLQKVAEATVDGCLEQQKRYVGFLVGTAHHCDMRNERPAVDGAGGKPPSEKAMRRRRRAFEGLPEHRKRTWRCVPAEHEATVQVSDFAAVTAAVSERGVALFRALLRKEKTGLSPLQEAILAEIHRQGRERFGAPERDGGVASGQQADQQADGKGRKAVDDRRLTLFIDYRNMVKDPATPRKAPATRKSKDDRTPGGAVKTPPVPDPREPTLHAVAVDGLRRLLVAAITGNDHGTIRVHLSNPVPHGTPVPVDLRLRADAVDRLCGGKRRIDGENAEQGVGSGTGGEVPASPPAFLSALPDIKTIALVIGPDRLEVKAVLAKRPPEPAPVETVTVLIAGDVGLRNAVSHVAVRLDKPLDPQRLETLAALDKDAAKRFLESHGAKRVHLLHVPDRLPRVWDSDDLLALVWPRFRRIDRISTDIDLGYARLDTLKGELNRAAGRDPKAHVLRDEIPQDTQLAAAHGRFFRLLDDLRLKKTARRGLYASVERVRKSWFGFLTNVEVDLARAFERRGERVAVVHEALDYVAKEKVDARYRGRAFNRWINASARGTYRRMGSGKLVWHGIREILVPAAWTSSACVFHGVVDKAMRDGDGFACPHCLTTAQANGLRLEDAVRHADLSASLTHTLLLTAETGVRLGPEEFPDGLGLLALAAVPPVERRFSLKAGTPPPRRKPARATRETRRAVEDRPAQNQRAV